MAVVCTLWLSIFLLFSIFTESAPIVDKIYPGFQASQMGSIDNSGVFLLSNSSIFSLGFISTSDPTLYLLAVVHASSQTVVWSANRNTPIMNSDTFNFGKNGNAFLQKGGSVVWSTDTDGKGVYAMELWDSGNLVLLRNDFTIIWQSFSHPTNTLLSNQDFTQGMTLVSAMSKNLTYILEIKSGDMILSASYESPQPYWTMGKDSRSIKDKDGGQVVSTLMVANSWRFYDENRTLLRQFIFSDNTDPNATWIAVLAEDGIISFYSLSAGGSANASPVKIPSDACSTPQPCDPYNVCYNGNMCRCLPVLASHPNCGSGLASLCNQPKASPELVSAGDGISYFALGFVVPSLTTDLNGCKTSCLSNCSCYALFFQNSSGNCFLFDSIGAFQSSNQNSGFLSYVKVLAVDGSSSKGNNKKSLIYVIIISVSAFIVVLCMIYVGLRYYKLKQKLPVTTQEISEDEDFLESFSGMPVRFTYKELQDATNNFSMKLGRGGFGSVYRGVLPDGTRLAVKQLEGIGQGKKEFRAEVCIIGSIHHHHLVRLKGFCVEGAHRLLAYEYMANGSLDKWIFKKDKEDMLDWATRYKIAIGTAKGMAYLHEDCDMKIVHCDIKPENVLLDDDFLAKVSDFGLAKLMTREQSHIFTTLRGTRGYLAPEWITNYAISEKSDVYSYGMLLLEIIGGRKNYNPEETSQKSHFPSYAFKMLEDGKLREILDQSLELDERDESVFTAVKVALWCIQEDMNLRPSMTKVVQMLEGLCPVSQPPSSPRLGSRLSCSFFRSTSEEATSSAGPSDGNSNASISAVRLSGPR